MNTSLSDLANIAQIASIPFTLLIWLVSKEKFSQFWERCAVWIFVLAVILGIIGSWNLGWLNWLWQQKIVLPLWSILLALIGLFVVAIIIMVRPSKQANDQYNVEESSLIQIGSLKWNATFSNDRLIDLERTPYCVQHEMKLVEQYPLYFCPLYGECNSSISRSDLPVAYQQAKSIMEAQIRKALK